LREKDRKVTIGRKITATTRNNGKQQGRTRGLRGGEAGEKKFSRERSGSERNLNSRKKIKHPELGIAASSSASDKKETFKNTKFGGTQFH